MSIAATALTVVMLAACLFCARDLWARDTLRAWVLVAVMNLAMIASHAPASATHHHGGGVNADAPVQHSTVMTLATTLAAVEVIAAAAVLYRRTRAIRPTGESVDDRRLEAGPASPAPSVGLNELQRSCNVAGLPFASARQRSAGLRGTDQQLDEFKECRVHRADQSDRTHCRRLESDALGHP